MRLFFLKKISLPRQARDKRRKGEKREAFSAGISSRGDGESAAGKGKGRGNELTGARALLEWWHAQGYDVAGRPRGNTIQPFWLIRRPAADGCEDVDVFLAPFHYATLQIESFGKTGAGQT